MANLYGSICLSDIPKEQIKAAPNGKKYLTIEIAPRRDGSDKLGNTHWIRCYVHKDAKVAGVNYYIGGVKESQWGGATAQPAQGQVSTATETSPQVERGRQYDEIDDWPF